MKTLVEKFDGNLSDAVNIMKSEKTYFDNMFEGESIEDLLIIEIDEDFINESLENLNRDDCLVVDTNKITVTNFYHDEETKEMYIALISTKEAKSLLKSELRFEINKRKEQLETKIEELEK